MNVKYSLQEFKYPLDVSLSSWREDLGGGNPIGMDASYVETMAVLGL